MGKLSFSEVQKIIAEKHENGYVGSFVLYRSPDGSWDAWVNQVLKLRELGEIDQTLATQLMQRMDAVGMNLISKNGRPDRVELKRKL